ncbi:MAG: hypothetical protein ACRC4M_05315 [Mycoplasma sp.]
MNKPQRWNLIWISEAKYNPYDNVDPNKKRPVLIWSKTLFARKYICFHCTTNKSDFKSDNLLDIGVLKKKETNTFMFVDRIYLVKAKDVEVPNNTVSLTDKKIQKQIKKKIKSLTSKKRFWRESNSKIRIVNKK